MENLNKDFNLENSILIFEISSVRSGRNDGDCNYKYLLGEGGVLC